jgi:hypothetical protein
MWGDGNGRSALLDLIGVLARGGGGDGVDIKGSSHHRGNLDHPIGPLLYTISCMHCMTVSLAQGGEGMDAMWGREKALEYFKAAGFSDVQINELNVCC